MHTIPEILLRSMVVQIPGAALVALGLLILEKRAIRRCFHLPDKDWRKRSSIADRIRESLHAIIGPLLLALGFSLQVWALWIWR